MVTEATVCLSCGWPWLLIMIQGKILDMVATNVKWHYIVTLSLTGWAHTKNDPHSCVWFALRLKGQGYSQIFIMNNIHDMRNFASKDEFCTDLKLSNEQWTDKESTVYILKSDIGGQIDNASFLVQLTVWQKTSSQAIIWTNDDPVHWHIYLSPGFKILDMLLQSNCSQ